MSDKLLFTSVACSGNDRVLAYLKNEKLTEIRFRKEQQESILQNIYVGKVQSVTRNLNAAFIEIERGQNCYYSMEELPFAVFTAKKGKKPLSPGDELLVQVVKAPVKSKAPVVSTKLSLPGRLCVAASDFHGIRCSSRLSEEEKKRLTEALSGCGEPFGLLLRTNGAFAAPEEIRKEYDALCDRLASILKKAPYQKCFSLLYDPSEESDCSWRDYPQNAYDELVTDSPEEYARLSGLTDKPVRLYEDSQYPLSKLYNLDKQIQDALKPRVWLKSGAYLVIQPTEALVAIDVNTGKCETGRSREETFFRINLEAAAEIARQIRLRRLSGIIIADFINMAEKSHTQALLDALRGYLQEDPQHPLLVDITELGLVEITRKKSQRPLHEIFSASAGVLREDCI